MTTTATPTKSYSGAKLPTPTTTSGHAPNVCICQVYAPAPEGNGIGRAVATGRVRRPAGEFTGPFTVLDPCHHLDVPDAREPSGVWVVYLPA